LIGVDFQSDLRLMPQLLVDNDLHIQPCGLSVLHTSRGDRWCNVKKAEDQRYLCNAYRVLLTRARQGMVIYVPQGDSADPTRSPTFYDATYHYLTEVGIPELK